MNRADAESFIVESAETFLVKARMSTVKDGTNNDLSQPIDLALRDVFIVPSIDGNPSDEDIEKVPVGSIKYFKCILMVEAFSYLAPKLTAVDKSMPSSGQKLSQYIAQALQMAEYWKGRADEFKITAADPTEQNEIAIESLRQHIPGQLDDPRHCGFYGYY
jgi:hypothetical protein